MEKQSKEGDRVRAWRAAILGSGHRRPPPDDTEQKGWQKAGLQMCEGRAFQRKGSPVQRPQGRDHVLKRQAGGWCFETEGSRGEQ